MRWRLRTQTRQARRHETHNWLCVVLLDRVWTQFIFQQLWFLIFVWRCFAVAILNINCLPSIVDKLRTTLVPFRFVEFALIGKAYFTLRCTGHAIIELLFHTAGSEAMPGNPKTGRSISSHPLWHLRGGRRWIRLVSGCYNRIAWILGYMSHHLAHAVQMLAPRQPVTSIYMIVVVQHFDKHRFHLLFLAVLYSVSVLVWRLVEVMGGPTLDLGRHDIWLRLIWIDGWFVSIITHTRIPSYMHRSWQLALMSVDSAIVAIQLRLIKHALAALSIEIQTLRLKLHWLVWLAEVVGAAQDILISLQMLQLFILFFKLVDLV